MKRIAYSFLLIAFMSCGPSLDTRMYSHVAIKFRDSLEKEFLLLSVREDRLIVSEYDSEGKILDGSLIGSAEAIPFTRVEKIYHPLGPDGLPIFLGGLAGCVCGGVIGTAVYYDANAGGGNRYPKAPYIGIAIGLPTGILIGYLLQSGDSHYSLSSTKEVDELRQHSFFHTEPPELQKIK